MASSKEIEEELNLEIEEGAKREKKLKLELAAMKEQFLEKSKRVGEIQGELSKSEVRVCPLQPVLTVADDPPVRKRCGSCGKQ
jgi:hypothetical protein